MKDLVSEEAQALCKITEGLERRLDEHEEVIGREGEEMRVLMAAAVEEGFRRAVSNPEVWSAAAGAMQKHVQQQAGGLVLGGLRALVSKLAVLALAAWAIYSLGGLQALLAWIKTGANP